MGNDFLHVNNAEFTTAKGTRQDVDSFYGVELTTLDTTDPGHCFAESLRVFSGIKAAGEQARTLRAWAEYDIQSGHFMCYEKRTIH